VLDCSSKPYLLGILLAVPAAMGFFLQWRDTSGATKSAVRKPPRKESEKEE